MISIPKLLILNIYVVFPFCKAFSQELPIKNKQIQQNKTKNSEDLKLFCNKIQEAYNKLHWGVSPCTKTPWEFSKYSENKIPLVYFTINKIDDKTKSTVITNKTLILSGVHGDEVNGVFSLFKFAEELSEKNYIPSGHMIIIAPLVNPDGFFHKKRNNANGVDLNRNLPTKDWETSAVKVWKTRRKSNPMHFPGNHAASEEGTKFQIDLIDNFEPDKIVSIHAPLDFVDYDGPGDSKKMSKLNSIEKNAKELAYAIAKKLPKTKLVDYPFFPGSLGNYAGNERGIPTITLELDKSNPYFPEKYWKDISPAILKAIEYDFNKLSLATSKNLNE